MIHEDLNQLQVFGQIETDITNNVSIYAKDSVYVGNLNKLETGINVKF